MMIQVIKRSMVLFQFLMNPAKERKARVFFPRLFRENAKWKKIAFSIISEYLAR